jgi:signal transduction histidine kinase
MLAYHHNLILDKGEPMPHKMSDSRIDALSEAVRAVTADLSLERVLRRLAEIAAHLVNARYAALGVPDGRGGLANFFTYGMTEKQIATMDHLPRGMGLLGALMQVDHAIRLEDMKMDVRSAGFCTHHPRMNSFLGVPIISKGQHLGSLYLSDRLDEQPFSDEDEQLVSLLAGHAAVAIENANLSDQLRKLAVIEERDRIAMELHDGIIQQIYAIGIRLEIARTTLVRDEKLDEQITGSTQALNHVIEDLRRYIRDLKTSVDYTVSLLDQLSEIAESFRRMSRADLSMDVARTFSLLNDHRVHLIIQITREAFSNIVRHSRATEASLRLYESNSVLHLEISDNGVGFDTALRGNGHGLPNIRQRAEQSGAQIEIISAPGHGTKLSLTLT